MTSQKAVVWSTTVCNTEMMGPPTSLSQCGSPNQQSRQKATNPTPQESQAKPPLLPTCKTVYETKSIGRTHQAIDSIHWKPNKIIDTNNPQEMDKHLLAYSKTHFGQAHGSPYTVPPLSTPLGYDGLTPFSQQVLSGTANIDHLAVPQHAKLLLTHQKYCTPLTQPMHQDMRTNILCKDFTNGKSTHPCHLPGDTSGYTQHYSKMTINRKCRKILNSCPPTQNKYQATNKKELSLMLCTWYIKC